MPRRSNLTERQRSALFDLPTDNASMLRHYTLADDDIEHINARRRAENRFGFALQLCALRYPGRLLSSDEVIPEKVLRFIAAQLGLAGDDILPYAARRQTRQIPWRAPHHTGSRACAARVKGTSQMGCATSAATGGSQSWPFAPSNGPQKLRMPWLRPMTVSSTRPGAMPRSYAMRKSRMPDHRCRKRYGRSKNSDH